MTIFAKPSLVTKKEALINEAHEVIDVPADATWTPPKKSSGLLCITLTAFVVAIVGMTTGFMLYRMYIKTNTIRHYQGFCSIPVTTNIESSYQAMPLRWSSEPEVQVISATDDDTSDELINTIREEFDIADNVEKIAVDDNGRLVDFIHDFENNITGIVDAERCFLMDMDPELLLPPDVLVLSIERGGAFDVSRVRTQLRALLPALQRLRALGAELARRCAARRVYRLEPDAGAGAIRKRSVDEPPHDYIQFAGKHIQEIDINNLGELLDYEQQNKV